MRAGNIKNARVCTGSLTEATKIPLPMPFVSAQAEDKNDGTRNPG